MLLSVSNAIREWQTGKIKITILPSIFPVAITGSSIYAQTLDMYMGDTNDPVLYTLKKLRKILVDFKVPVFAIELLRVQKLYYYYVNGKAVHPTEPALQLRIEKYPCVEWIDSNYGRVMKTWATRGTSKYEI